MSKFSDEVKVLYDEIRDIEDPEEISIEFSKRFLNFISIISSMLIKGEDNFFGYFLLKMDKRIKYDITSAASTTFSKGTYILYFNPYIFLTLTGEQMKTAIKHEIYHVAGLHMLRKKSMGKRFSSLACDMAMDMVVNQYLNYLPPYSITIESVNNYYNLQLKPFMTMEYYAEKLQREMDLMEENHKSADEDDTKGEDFKKALEDMKNNHDTWKYEGEYDDKTIREFTENLIHSTESLNVIVPDTVKNMIKTLKKSEMAVPWNVYLKRFVGNVSNGKKKTSTRLSRRQPDRTDLRGELTSHSVKLAVAFDSSGSISDTEFKKGINEVLNIVKNYNHSITMMECDTEIRQTYKIKSQGDIKERINTRGGTAFSPVIEKANTLRPDLLIYFTDGLGEEVLTVKPRGYKILWILTGKEKKISLKEPLGIIKPLKFDKDKNEDNIVFLDVVHDGWSMNNQEPIYK